jgi:hypothetical protein
MDLISLEMTTVEVPYECKTRIFFMIFMASFVDHYLRYDRLYYKHHVPPKNASQTNQQVLSPLDLLYREIVQLHTKGSKQSKEENRGARRRPRRIQNTGMGYLHGKYLQKRYRWHELILKWKKQFERSVSKDTFYGTVSENQLKLVVDNLDYLADIFCPTDV